MARRKPRPTTRERLKSIYAKATAGDPGILKKHAMKPIPASMKGPAKSKSGVGRPRTGNLATTVDAITGTELGRSHAHLDHAYNRFLDGIEEADLQQALAVDPKKKFQDALLVLTHPNYRSGTRHGTGKPGAWSTAAVLKHVGITLQDLMDVYGRYRVSQAVRIAMDRSPRIMEHTADDAENRKVVCSRCDGLGTLDMDAAREEVQEKRRKAIVRTCPECKGTGEVVQSGDAEARKLVLEVAGIAGKRGPMVDARSVHYGHGVFNVESLVKGMEQLEAPETAPEDRSILEAEEEPVNA